MIHSELNKDTLHASTAGWHTAQLSKATFSSTYVDFKILHKTQLGMPRYAYILENVHTTELLCETGLRQGIKYQTDRFIGDIVKMDMQWESMEALGLPVGAGW